MRGKGGGAVEGGEGRSGIQGGVRGKGGGEVEGGVREEWNTGRSEREGRGRGGGRGEGGVEYGEE